MMCGYVCVCVCASSDDVDDVRLSNHCEHKPNMYVCVVTHAYEGVEVGVGVRVCVCVRVCNSHEQSIRHNDASRGNGTVSDFFSFTPYKQTCGGVESESSAIVLSI